MFKTNKMGRKIVAGLTITAMLASLAGCSGSTGSSGDTSDGSSDTSGGDLPILGASIYSSGDNFNTYLASAIEKNAANGYFECTVEDAQNDQATMNDQVDAMIAKGANAIALSLVDISGAQTIIQKAQNAGDIPVIFFNKEVTDTEVLASYDNCYQITSTAGGYGADIQAEQIEALKKCFDDDATQIATLVKPLSEEDGAEVLDNVNIPKVVVDKNMYAMYFSRSVIPFVRGYEKNLWLKLHKYYRHIGIYAYRGNVLDEITKLKQSSLELAESLEQLRWLENGYKIKVGVTNIETVGIDTPEDLERAEEFLKHSENIF